MTAADEIMTQTPEQKEQEKQLQQDLDAVTMGLEEEKPRKRKRRKRRTKAEMAAAKATIVATSAAPKKRGRKPSKKASDPVVAAPAKTQVFKLAGLPKSVKVVENKRGIILTTSVEKKVVIKGSEITMTSSINGVKKVNIFSKDELGAKAFGFVVSTFF